MLPPFPVFTKLFHNSVYPAINPTNDVLTAKEKCVLIVGGSRGIGKSIAEAFVLAGARAVVLLGRINSSLEATEKDLKRLAATSGVESVVRSFAVDICNVDTVFDVFKTTRQELGPIDVMIQNAGGLQLGMIADSDTIEYWKSFETNVRGALNCVQALLRFGLEKHVTSTATVINVSTIGIAMSPVPTMSSYGASKLATWKIMECLDIEMGDRVRVFSIHPGRIETDMSKQANIPTADDRGESNGRADFRAAELTCCRTARCLLRLACCYAERRLLAATTCCLQLGCGGVASEKRRDRGEELADYRTQWLGNRFCVVVKVEELRGEEQ
jgi:NAD(P)-dependent dehydrogenase (short-subunit alcohol dehydrogenase family)